MANPGPGVIYELLTQNIAGLPDILPADIFHILRVGSTLNPMWNSLSIFGNVLFDVDVPTAIVKTDGIDQPGPDQIWVPTPYNNNANIVASNLQYKGREYPSIQALNMPVVLPGSWTGLVLDSVVGNSVKERGFITWQPGDTVVLDLYPNDGLKPKVRLFLGRQIIVYPARMAWYVLGEGAPSPTENDFLAANTSSIGTTGLIYPPTTILNMYDRFQLALWIATDRQYSWIQQYKENSSFSAAGNLSRKADLTVNGVPGIVVFPYVNGAAYNQTAAQEFIDDGWKYEVHYIPNLTTGNFQIWIADISADIADVPQNSKIHVRPRGLIIN